MLGSSLRRKRLIRRIGLKTYLKYKLAPKGKEIKTLIDGHQIVVRKGTPDLKVALSCLDGEFEVLRHIFPSNYNGIIVDAGGYIGTSAIALKDIFPKAKLVVVEPSKDNLSILKKNLSEVDDVKIVHAALIGTDELSIQLNNNGTGEWGYTVLKSPKDNPNPIPLHETPAVRLADLVSKNESIGLLKLDIEGAELSLLENDIDTMHSIKAVFAELHERSAPGCEKRFFEFSKDRVLIKDKGEKYLSIKR